MNCNIISRGSSNGRKKVVFVRLVMYVTIEYVGNVGTHVVFVCSMHCWRLCKVPHQQRRMHGV